VAKALCGGEQFCGSRLFSRGKVRLNHAMVNDRDETKSVDANARLARTLGLESALRQYPELVRAAAAKGLRALAPPPSGPLTDPAPVFDPSGPERHE
jgi:hypothetical protein